MKVFLTQLGCRLNEAEVSTWIRALGQRGHHVVSHAEDANVVVVNTCAVTKEASRKSKRLVNSLHKKSPTAKLVVTGCFSELEPAAAKALTGVDLLVANQDKDSLVSLLETSLDMDAAVQRSLQNPSLPTLADGRTRAFIKVQDGCRNQCAFCIVTVARGEERSRTIGEIINEINYLADSGVREAVLTGVHLGGYGSEIGSSLAELVEAILNQTSIARLRLSSLEPWDLPDDFGRFWQDARLLPHLHLPLQSGSTATLRRMARRCMAASYQKLVSRLRQDIPDLCVTTDVIVGFPGETEDEWRESLDFVRAMEFSHIHMFSFSAREGTRAASMPNQVDAMTKRERYRQLHEVAEISKRRVYEKYLGTTRQVLWETGRNTPDGRMFMGYTDNYLQVQTVAPLTAKLQHQVTSVKLRALDPVAATFVVDPPMGYELPAERKESLRLPVVAR